MRKGGWGWGRAKNWQQRLPPMHSPQGWRKCGGGRVNNVQGPGAEELGGRGVGGTSTTGKQAASSNTFIGHD